MIGRREALGAMTGGAALAGLGMGRVAWALPAAHGQFIGRVVTEWSDEPQGRHMRLLEPFSYIDAMSHRWDVPSGATIDGASIPKIAWTAVGAPYEGPYRRPSVVHDWYCDVRTERWQDVHLMFLHGMLDAGVPKSKAEFMYWAVYYGGPRWDEQTIANNRLLARRVYELSQGPAPAVVQTCDPDGSACRVVYRNPAAMPLRPKARGLFEGLFGMFVAEKSAAVVASSPSPQLLRVETAPMRGAVSPPVTDPAKLMALAARLSNARVSLSEGQMALDPGRSLPIG